MKELKFKIWDNLNQKWVNGIPSFVFEDECYTIYDVDDEDGCILNIPEFSVVDYTGIKDKNNIEVYDGWLLEDEDFKLCLVKWSNIDSGYVVYAISEFGYLDLIGSIGEYAKYMKVIGNIYENTDINIKY